MRLPHLKVAPVESSHQQVVPQRRPSQHSRASSAGAQPRAARDSIVSAPDQRASRATDVTHHTRVAMSHTSNAVSSGEPTARNWPHGLQHKACCSGGPRVTHVRIQQRAHSGASAAHRGRLLHASRLQRGASPGRWWRKASDACGRMCQHAERVQVRTRDSCMQQAVLRPASSIT
jgi:hypothetical protein